MTRNSMETNQVSILSSENISVDCFQRNLDGSSGFKCPGVNKVPLSLIDSCIPVCDVIFGVMFQSSSIESKYNQSTGNPSTVSTPSDCLGTNVVDHPFILDLKEGLRHLLRNSWPLTGEICKADDDCGFFYLNRVCCHHVAQENANVKKQYVSWETAVSQDTLKVSLLRSKISKIQ